MNLQHCFYRLVITMLFLSGLRGQPGAFGQDTTPVFKSDVRLVEVYATVFDGKGRYIDGLTRERFEVSDNGEPQPILAFEAINSDLSCAILLDTTGSMASALQVVKNAILKLIDELREHDWVAVYSFSTSLNVMQEFTRDKSAAKRAVLRTRASGATALFDAVSQVAISLSQRKGKKAIIAFTDGIDNASVLHAADAMARAKKAGVPLYTVAQGEALKSERLVQQLKELSQMTGGQAYMAKKSEDIEEIFKGISADLQHTYMLAYQAPTVIEPKWRFIQLSVKGLKGHRIRAKEGYFPY